ncbi:hypothetical protein BKP54_13760 [Ensifer sp. 1H6]|nr:hypothetical protein BKP54_13760 [Ensifer sp. 1H6]
MHSHSIGGANPEQTDLCEEGSIRGISRRPNAKEAETGHDRQTQTDRGSARQKRPEPFQRSVPEETEQSQVQRHDRADQKRDRQDMGRVDDEIEDRGSTHR